MDLNSPYVEDQDESSVVYTKMPFGNPGEESLRCGGLFETTLQFQTNSNEEPTRRMPYAHSSGYDAVDTVDAFQLSGCLTDPCMPYWAGAVDDSDLCWTSWDDFWLSKELGMHCPDASITISSFQKESPRDPSRNDSNLSSNRVSVQDGFCTDSLRDTNWPREARMKPNVTEDSDMQLHSTENQFVKKPKTNEPPKMQKGVTMCLRTLLRQLLAGTGWIIDYSLNKDRSYTLIHLLIGSKLRGVIEVELSSKDEAIMPKGWGEPYYTHVLADVMTFYLGKKIENEESEKCFTLTKGPYRLTPHFQELLGTKPWPPFLPDEDCMRAFGCRRIGEIDEKRKRKRRQHKLIARRVRF